MVEVTYNTKDSHNFVVEKKNVFNSISEAIRFIRSIKSISIGTPRME